MLQELKENPSMLQRKKNKPARCFQTLP